MNHYDKIETDNRKIKAIEKLEKYLATLQSSADPQLQKKASLLCVWIKTFVQYLDFEDRFDPTRLKKYKRGDIIKLDFGFNLGSELGGPHYSIVLDNNNSINSPVITVVPLSSKRESYKPSLHNVDLGDEIYVKLKIKFDSLFQSANSELVEVKSLAENVDKLRLKINHIQSIPPDNDSVDSASNEIDIIQSDIKSRIKKINDKIEILTKTKAEIDKMKKGSVAQIGQITTVSKMRIFDPKTNTCVLHGIKLTDYSLDLIDAKISELYFKRAK